MDIHFNGEGFCGAFFFFGGGEKGVITRCCGVDIHIKGEVFFIVFWGLLIF